MPAMASGGVGGKVPPRAVARYMAIVAFGGRQQSESDVIKEGH